MSFGKSPDDYKELAGAAHATLVNARLACGDGDALTLNISSLHHVLSRLSDDVEAVDADQVGAGVEKRKRDGDNRWMELATLARDCERFLRILNQILGKYNVLSAEKRKVTKLWRTVKFANGETLDLDKLRNDMGVYTQAIGLFLKLVENGTKGKVEGYMDAHGAELREIKHTLHWCIAKLLAAGDDGDGSRALRNWRAGTRDGGLWKVVKKELVGEGWEQRVLGRHQRVIVRYVMELGERGVLDGGVSGGLGLDADDDGGLESKSNDLTDDDSDSETESESSLDEESGTDMPLGRRRSSTVSAQSRPSAQSIGVTTRKRSFDKMDSSEEEEEDEQPGTNIQRVSTSAMKNSSDPVTPPTPITPSYAPTLDQTRAVTTDTGLHLNAPVSNTMALSISNLPPLPLSRPRSRNSEHDNRLIDVQDLSEKISAALPGPTPSQSGSEILVLSSVLSDHRDDEDQDDKSNVEEECLDLLNVKSDSDSESDEELRLPKVSVSQSTAFSALSLGLFNDSADLVLRQKDKVDLLTTRNEEKELQGEDPFEPKIIVIPHPGSPNHPAEPVSTTASQKPIALSSALHSSHIIDKTTGPVDSLATTDLSKFDKVPPLGIPIIFKAPVYSPVAASPVKKGKEIAASEERSDHDFGGTSFKSEFKNDSSAPAIESKRQEKNVEQASTTRPETFSTANATLPEQTATEKLKMDRRKDIEPKTTQFLRPKNDSGLRAINSESSIARPQIQRTYASVLSSSRPTLSTSDNKSSDKPSHVARPPTNQLSQSQPNIRNESGPSEAVVSPRLTAPLSSADFHYELDAVETERSREITDGEDNSEDESEHSYLIIRGATESQLSYEDEQEQMRPIISQTESMESFVGASITTGTGPKPSDQKEVIVEENKHGDIQEGEGEGQGIMNAWSVILSQVGDDPETSLLETSGVWAQSNPTTRPASAQQIAKEAVRNQELKDILAASPEEQDEDKIQTRSRNVTLVGDSDDEPKPPKASELWPETMQLISPSATASDSRPSQRSHIPESRFNDSETEGSVTVDGGSEDDPMSPIKSVMLTSVILPVVSDIFRGKAIEQEVNLDSDLSSSDEEAAVEENPAQTNNAHFVSEDLQSSPEVSKTSPHQATNTPPEPTGFRKIKYQLSPNANDHEKKEPSDVGPHDHMNKQPSKRAGRSSGSSTSSIAEQSWNKEVETRTKEYQAQTEAANHSETAAKTPPSPVKSVPIFRQIASFGSSNGSWWWTLNKAARAKYQPTVEDVNDEDSLPGAHPNCWSNDNEEFSQSGSDVKTTSTVSSSAQKNPKPHLAQFLNPFKERSKARAYRIDPTTPACPSDEEASSFGFPSSDENEEVRRYRSGKQIEYVDPDLSFNSGLEESSDAGDELDKVKHKEMIEATAEKKEAFKKKIKADRYNKKGYRLEKGKEAVWGSASEREERRKVRTMRKKGLEAPKVIGGKKTVTFDMNNHHTTRPHERAEMPNGKNRQLCQAFVEEVRDEDFLPGAHPNCDAASSSLGIDDVFAEQDMEASVPVLVPILKTRPANTSSSPSKAGSSSRPARPKRTRTVFQMPQSDDDKDEDLRRYRREQTAQPPTEDAAPSWRSTRAYRSRKSKQRRFSHGEDEKFWDEPSQWGGEAGSSEDDWGETYRFDNSRNSSIVAIGGCTCCVAEPQTKRRRQHYRSPPVIHHPELNPVNPFLPENSPSTAVVQAQQHTRRRSSIDPWSPDPPSARRHRREKASESPTYHVPDAPAPVLNSTRPAPALAPASAPVPVLNPARLELPRRRTENPERSPQATRPDIARRRTSDRDRERERGMERSRSRSPVKPTSRPEVQRRMTDRNRERSRSRSPAKVTSRPEVQRRMTDRNRERSRSRSPARPTSRPTSRPDMQRRTIDRDRLRSRSRSPAKQNARPDIQRRTIDRDRVRSRSRSPSKITSRPEMARRRTDQDRSLQREMRPEMPKRRAIDREREVEPDRDREREKRPEMQRRGTVDREFRPREKLLRFDIK